MNQDLVSDKHKVRQEQERFAGTVELGVICEALEMDIDFHERYCQGGEGR